MLFCSGSISAFNHSIGSWLSLVMVALMLWAHPSLGQQIESGNRLAGLVSFNMPQFPKDLVGVKAGDAEVVVAITISDQGNVSDSVVLEATNESVAAAALRAVASWTFSATPRTNLSAETLWPRRELLQFSFRRSGVVTSLNHLEAAKDGFVFTPQPELRTVQWQVLENKPKPINLSLSNLPGSVVNSPSNPAVVNFIIDRQGAVRVPVITGLDNLEIAESVIMDIRRWRYSAPIQQKTAVLVEVTKAFSLPIPKSR